MRQRYALFCNLPNLFAKIPHFDTFFHNSSPLVMAWNFSDNIKYVNKMLNIRRPNVKYALFTPIFSQREKIGYTPLTAVVTLQCNSKTTVNMESKNYSETQNWYPAYRYLTMLIEHPEILAPPQPQSETRTEPCPQPTSPRSMPAIHRPRPACTNTPHPRSLPSTHITRSRGAIYCARPAGSNSLEASKRRYCDSL